MSSSSDQPNIYVSASGQRNYTLDSFGIVNTGGARPRPLSEASGDLTGLPYAIAERPLRYSTAVPGPASRSQRGQAQSLTVWRVPPLTYNARTRTWGGAPYGARLRPIVSEMWRLLGQEWKNGSKLLLRYGFHPKNPNLQQHEDDGNPVMKYKHNAGTRAAPVWKNKIVWITSHTFWDHVWGTVRDQWVYSFLRSAE